jgi:DUF4097 and DUF4098 domain-containing protein YvlB
MYLRFPLILALTASTAFALSEERVHEQMDVASGGKLVVDVEFGSIDVSAATDGKVSVEAYRKIDSSDEGREKEYLASSPIVVSKEGNTVTVRARRTNGDKRWSWSGTITMDARYTVRVPKQFNAELRTSGGTIAANGLSGEIKADTSGGKLKFTQLKGPLNARTSGGGIQMSGCEGPQVVSTSGGDIECDGGSGRLEAKTSGGAIAVRNFTGDTDVKTSGGKLTLENIKGALSGKTSAGAITASLVDPVPGDVTLHTSAGSIDVAVPAKAGFNVDCKANMGNIRTEIPMLATRSDDDRLEGTLNGGGKALLLKTSVGSITIKPAGSPTVSR